jgi:hypothetical protein
VAITGAVAFMVICTWTALWYDRNEARIKGGLSQGWVSLKGGVVSLSQSLLRSVKALISQVVQYFTWGQSR